LLAKGFLLVPAHRAKVQELLPFAEVVKLLNGSSWGIRLAFAIVEGSRETKRAG
jgi:hypothetical protein